MLGQLGIDPLSMHKRLGDGYYEQKLIRDQIAQLTGRRFLDGYSSDDAQYKALMQAGLTFANEFGLRPGIALTAEQMARLTSDIVWLVEREVTLPDGTKVKALVPQVYVVVRKGDLSNTGALLAANQIQFNLTGDLTNSGSIAGRDIVSLNALNIHNLKAASISGAQVGLTAVNDITNIGGTLKATDALVLNAGRNITMASTTQSQSGSGPYSWSQTGIDRVAGLYVTNPNGLGILALNAGKDITLNAVTISNAGQNGISQIKAGNSINLGTVGTAQSQNFEWDANNYTRIANTREIGTTISTANHVALDAGTDINAKAANIYSSNGQVALIAGNNVNLQAGTNTDSFEDARKWKSSGLLSSTTTTTKDEAKSTTAVGTSLSGESIVIKAGNDITTRGASVVATNGVALNAGNSIDIGTAQNTSHEFHSKDSKTSGIFSDGGLGVTIGNKKQASTVTVDTVTNTGSVIGSLDGAVSIVAGKDVTVSGSDVISQTGTLISGQNVTVQNATDTQTTVQTNKTSSSGLHVYLKGGAADVANSVIQSTRRAAEVDDPRLQALYAAKTAQTLFSDNPITKTDGMDALKGFNGEVLGLNDAAAAKKPGDGKSGGMSLRVGVGASSTNSDTRTSETFSSGSRIQSEGDIRVVATGGDVIIQGSEVSGQNVALDAAKNLVVRSAVETSTSENSSKSSGGEVGFTMGSEAGYGFYVSASASKGNGQSNTVNHAESVIKAADTLSFRSGQDTTITGGQLIGSTVAGSVGGNLTITSLQDTDTYRRKDQSAGIDAAFGTGGGTLSVNVNQSKMNSDYKSVNEQSGIQAGAGGFDITVNGHTQLNGAALASSADSNRNSLTTGSLAFTDLANSANYSSSSAGFSASGGTEGGGFSPNFSTPQRGDSESLTKAGIANGRLTVSDGAGSGIERGTVELQQEGLKQIFDEKKIFDNWEVGQVFLQVGMTAARDLISSQQHRIAQEAKAAQEAMASATTPEQVAEAKNLLDAVKTSADHWGEKGLYKVTVQSLVGALRSMAGGGNAFGALGGVLMNEALLSQFSRFLQGKGLTEGEGTHDSIMSLVALVLGAAGGVISGDGGSGAAAANSAQIFGYYDYRDGRAMRQTQIADALNREQIGDPAVKQAIGTLVDNAILLGANPADISLILQSPDAIQVLSTLAKPDTKAIEAFGKPFNDLSQDQQAHVISLLVGKVSVGNVHPITEAASGVPGQPGPPGGLNTTQGQVGDVLSNLIITGGQKTEQIVNWFGKDAAEAAAFLTMAALGGPVKYGVSYVWSQTPIAQGVEKLKETYLVQPGAAVIGEYGFSAKTPTDQQNVYPASHAVSSILVEGVLYIFGIQNSGASAKNMVNGVHGLGKKVKNADDLEKGAVETSLHAGKYFSKPSISEITGFTGLFKAKPKTPVQGGGKLRDRWKDKNGTIYEWDSQHGTIEKYNKTGKHLGEFDYKSGAQLKPADPTRKVEP